MLRSPLPRPHVPEPAPPGGQTVHVPRASRSAFPAGAPISILVDYDGTVSRQDVGDKLLADHALVSPVVVAAKDADYDAGRSGSRDLMQWDMDVLPRDGALLRSFAAGMPQDETFVPSSRRCAPRAPPSRSSATASAST